MIKRRMKKIKILFVSHSYPPVVGGVETQNFELASWLSKYADVTVVANRRRRLLPLFLLYVPLRILLLASRHDIILLGSGILGHAGYVAKKLTRTPVAAMTHGLDLTWCNALYQRWWSRCFIPRLDRLIAVGNETVAAGVERGIPADKFVFIPNGVNADVECGTYGRVDLEAVLGQSLAGQKVVLGFGRLAKRKGVAWFVENVLPRLPKNVLYVIAGGGPEKAAILASVERMNLQAQVRFLGYVDDRVRNILLGTVDIFVQPNIKVAGDMEGFGIAVIEASLNRRVVVAARLEGLQDAVKDGCNGFLLPSGDADAFAEKIASLLDDDAFRDEFGGRARRYTIEHFHWAKISQEYMALLRTLLG